MPLVEITTSNGVENTINVDEVQTYLDGLPPENITKIYVGRCNLTVINNLARFTNLICLDCDNNELTTLPELPDSLISLECSGNHQLTA